MSVVNYENRAIIAIASIYALRMLGFFMILPVFTLYAHNLQGATPLLIGLAFGIYGLSQAVLQIPLGFCSDRFGRKNIITIGLLLLIGGSIIAAVSDSIITMIIGRALQGAGAIGSALTALLADVTQTQKRTKAMAIVGLFISLSFAVAMLTATLLSSWIGLSGIFWLIAALALAAIALLHIAVPTPPALPARKPAQTDTFKIVLTDTELWRLNFGIFIQHAIFSACFFILPIILQQIIGLSEQAQWQLYLPIILVAFLCILPIITIAEKYQQTRIVFLIAIAIMALNLAGLGFYYAHSWLLTSCFLLYFIGFNYLEASLPSLASQIAAKTNRGTAMGVYASCQFLGIFVGAMMAGWIYAHQSISWIFFICAIMASLWLYVAFAMQIPRRSRSMRQRDQQQKVASDALM